MGVFKMDRSTTKFRVVFLSNLCQSDKQNKMSFSHNQLIHSSPPLNQKITTALLQLRFGEKLLCVDLKKDFLRIALNEIDFNRLLFLWFKDVAKGDYEVVAYRILRLSFGLRCSPAILMIAIITVEYIYIHCYEYIYVLTCARRVVNYLNV